MGNGIRFEGRWKAVKGYRMLVGGKQDGGGGEKRMRERDYKEQEKCFSSIEKG